MKIPSELVDPSSIVIPKKPPHKSASEHRRATKPIMEKRRRARINNSLEQIKTLILLALHKDPAKHSKLEKADILEMTVEYLKGLNSVQPVDQIKNIKAGFDECASQVSKFVDIVPDMDLAIKRRLKSHLNNFTPLNINNNNSNNNTNDFVSSTTSSISSIEQNEPLILSRDALTPITLNHNNLNDIKSEPYPTPPPSAKTHNLFSYPPTSLNNHHYQHNNNIINNHHHHNNNTILEDVMDFTPVDFSKSSKIHNNSEDVWRPWHD